MELKDGYKKTDIGIIPYDWEIHRIGDFMDFKGGSQPDKNVFSINKKEGYIRLIQIRDYKTDKYKIYIPYSLARRFCDESDIMIGRYGPPIFQILKGIKGAYNVALIKAIPNGKLTKNYAYYYLKQESLFSFIEKLSQRSSGQTGVDLKELKNYPLPLPPTKAEQTAIAKALSDADAWIQSLTQLIAKKRKIKQGVMQTLFNPYEDGRLKEGWVEKKLGDICQPSSKRINPRTDGNNYKCIELENISQETGRVMGFIDSKNQLSQKAVFNKGDVLFSKLRPYLKKYFYAEFDGVCSTEIWVLKSNNNINSLWLYYLVQSEPIIEAANKSTGTKMPRAEWRIVKNTEVYIPTNINEQVRISSVLSNMDREITVVEFKLNKAKKIKQGMMQKLLTGRIRLI